MPTARCAGMRVRDRRPPSDAETSYLDRRRNAAYNLLSLSAAFRAPPGLCGRASHRAYNASAGPLFCSASLSPRLGLASPEQLFLFLVCRRLGGPS